MSEYIENEYDRLKAQKDAILAKHVETLLVDIFAVLNIPTDDQRYAECLHLARQFTGIPRRAPVTAGYVHVEGTPLNPPATLTVYNPAQMELDALRAAVQDYLAALGAESGEDSWPPPYSNARLAVYAALERLRECTT